MRVTPDNGAGLTFKPALLVSVSPLRLFHAGDLSPSGEVSCYVAKLKIVDGFLVMTTQS